MTHPAPLSRRRCLHTVAAWAAGAAGATGAFGEAGLAFAQSMPPPVAGAAAPASALPASALPACLHPAYEVSTHGKPAGYLRASMDGATLVLDYHYRENGRGPDLIERLSLEADGRPVRYESEGKATFGAAIAERFVFTTEGRIRWRSRVDDGDEAARPGEWFMPLEPSPGYLGLMAAGLLRLQGTDRAPLTSGGPGLRAVVVERVTLSSPQQAQRLEVDLVALEGLDVAPLWVWMQPAAQPGGQPRLFGLLEEGYWSLLPPGMASHAPTLVQAQSLAKERRLRERQASLSRELPGLTLLAGVRWFDAPAGVLRGPSDVWLLDGRIRSITPPGQLTDKPERRIEGAGRTLLPGLFDMHGHLSRGDLLLHLAFGVTTVRDLGNDNADLLRMRTALEQGRLLGPNVVPLGFIEGASPFAASGGIVAATLQEALAAVDWYHVRGYRQLKLYNSIKPEWVVPIVQHARRKGLKVGGHVPAFMRAEEVVRAGYGEIAHINQLMLNFVVQPGDDTRTLQRFTRVGDDAHAVSLQSPRAQAFLKLLGERRTVVDPTLVAFEGMYTQQQGQFNPSLADIREHLPATWRRRLLVAELDLAGPKLQTYRGSWQQLLALTAALHKAGAVVVPGTDGPSGAGLHRELALLVQAGLTPAQALQSATWVSAGVCGVQNRTGRIAPGLQADLVLVDGNPLERITDLRRASLVIRGALVIEPAAVLESLGFRAFVPGALG